jgi:hypothetical protein
MDLMSSLKSLLPTYETILPFSKQKVIFRPFKVKDAKSISVILQEENKKLALISLVELLKNNTENVNIMNLCMADAEFLFLQIRSKSVDEQLNLIYNQEKIQVYIPDIKHRNEISSDTVTLTNSVFITLETPTIKDLLKLDTLDKEDFLKACIKKVNVGGEVFHVNKFISEDIKTILDNLPLNILPKFEEFMKTQPELFVVLETKDGDKEVNGLLRFFTFR